MKRKSYLSKYTQALLAVLLLLAQSPSVAQQRVDVKYTIQGDFLHIDSSGSKPTLRMNQSPSFLELAYPGKTLQRKPLSKAIDRGLVQKFVTSQNGSTALARIHVLSKPKSKLIKTKTGYRLTVNMQQLAGTPTRTASAKPKPAQKASPKEKPAAATPKPAAASPKPVAAIPKTAGPETVSYTHLTLPTTPYV